MVWTKTGALFMVGHLAIIRLILNREQMHPGVEVVHALLGGRSFPLVGIADQVHIEWHRLAGSSLQDAQRFRFPAKNFKHLGLVMFAGLVRASPMLLSLVAASPTTMMSLSNGSRR